MLPLLCLSSVPARAGKGRWEEGATGTLDTGLRAVTEVVQGSFPFFSQMTQDHLRSIHMDPQP